MQIESAQMPSTSEMNQPTTEAKTSPQEMVQKQESSNKVEETRQNEQEDASVEAQESPVEEDSVAQFVSYTA
jgi:hypothetical protein